MALSPGVNMRKFRNITVYVGKKDSGYQEAYLADLCSKASSTGLYRNLGDSTHPDELVELLESLGVEPVIATTHNPNLVDFLSPENVVIFSKGRSKRLSSHPQFAKLSKHLTTGELWMAVGDDWI